MGKGLADFATQAGQQALGAGLGLILGKAADKRQLKQQGKLMQQEIGGQKQMSDYNYAKQMEMWNATNYGPQMEQLKKAGLNPGLIYGMSGGGAVTTGNQGGNVTGAHATSGAPEAIAMSQTTAQLGLLRAQKELIEAQTAKEKAQIPVLGATVPNIQANTANLKQQTENAKAQKELIEAEEGIKNVELHIKQKTQQQAIALFATELRRITALMHTAETQQRITAETADKNIEIVGAELAGIYARNELTRAQEGLTYQQVAKSKAEIDQIVNEIGIAWGYLWNEKDKTTIQRKLQEFETSFGKQASDVLKSVLGTMGDYRGRKTTVTHQGGAQNTTTHRRE